MGSRERRHVPVRCVIVGGVVPALALVLWATVSAAEGQPYEDVKRQYIAAVDAVCEEASRQSDLREEPPANLREEVDELHRASESMTGTIAAIEAIAPPSGDVARVRERFFVPARALTASLRELSGSAEAALRAGREGEAKKAVERSLASDENEKALRSFAAEYGFRACAGE
ncbi:hypothetical protein [Nonomuraea guangzhouensis]|uniref:Uncharacterized protein n=1 Tax=Nonomuraea guangzhouensis TaxID=1291555 RepID=A0ABW4GFB3_9ACTN|nr:hypothetical protein [Nonomuraea guangzhouensis]